MTERTAVTTLRPAASEDLEPLARLWHQGWHDGHDGHVPEDVYPHRRLEDFRRRLPERLPQTTVARGPDGSILGFVTVHDQEVEQLYVAPPARGTGTAAALLDHAVAGIPGTPWLAVVAGNFRARRFYERHGWVDRGPFDAVADGLVIPALRYEKEDA